MKRKIQVLLNVGVVGAGLLGAGNARAFYDRFDTYSNGPLAGQGGWVSSGSGITAGINVVDGSSPISAPKVAQFDDSVSDTLEIRNVVGQDGQEVLSFYARHDDGNTIGNTSGFTARMNATVDAAGAAPDPFFSVGFSSGAGDFIWNQFDGGSPTDGSVSGVVLGRWYQFIVNYDRGTSDNCFSEPCWGLRNVFLCFVGHGLAFRC